MTEPDPRVVETAARLAREQLAPRAADYDRDAKNPVDSWQALWREGFLGVANPRAHGGLGLDMQSAAAWDAADIVERGLLANRAKYLASEVGLEVTSRVIQTVGGRGAYRDFLAERAFRDMRTATLMPPTADRMLETIGKGALGLTEAMFRVSTGPQGA